METMAGEATFKNIEFKLPASATEATAQITARLREIVKRFEAKKVSEPLKVSWAERGIPRGAITEVGGSVGSGKTSRIVSVLKENPKLKVAWIEEDFSLYPIALSQAGVNLAQVLFVEAKQKTSWSALQCLKSQLFEVVVIHTPTKLNDVVLRRLQLAAEKNDVALLLICDEKREQKSWAVRESIQLNLFQQEATVCERSAS